VSGGESSLVQEAQIDMVSALAGDGLPEEKVKVKVRLR